MVKILRMGVSLAMVAAGGACDVVAVDDLGVDDTAGPADTDVAYTADTGSPPDYRAGANPNHTNRWYGVGTGHLNRVTYYIDPSMSAAHQASLQAAIDAYNDLTGLDFRPGPTQPGSWLPAMTDPEPHLLYVDYPAVSETNSYTNLQAKAADPPYDVLFATYGPYMRPAAPGRHDDFLIHFKTGRVFDILPTLDSTVLGAAVPEHETAHALGMFHEQNRSDSASTVTVWWCCVDPSRISAFATNDPANELLLSPYDIHSMMQYASETGCDIVGGSCVCTPVTANPPSSEPNPIPATDTEPACALDPAAPRPETGFLIGEATGFSQEDLNVLYQLYPPRLDTYEAGDQDGFSIAAGDFNGDGYDDLAVGAPGEVVGGVRTGRVYVYRGTWTGLMPWRRINEPGANQDDGDRFGFSLAAADLDGDGKSELLVGAPRRSLDGGPRTGAVFLYTGNIVGFGQHRNLSADGTGFSASAGGDRFGDTLTTGDFDGDGQVEIVVGAPNAHFVYVIGRDEVGGSVVYSKVARWGASRDVADEFGASLATGDLDGDGKDDLVIGAPGAGAGGAGKVYYVLGDVTGGVAGGITGVAEPGGSTTSRDRFGAAVAVGHFRLPGAGSSLAVGAPGRVNGQGSVFVYAAGVPGTASERRLAAFGVPNQPGAGFGAELAVGQLDMVGGQELVVGVPGATATGQAEAGLVAIFRGARAGDTSNLTAADLFAAPAVTIDPEAGEHFGAALAIGDFDRRPITVAEGDTVPHTYARVGDLAVSTPDRSEGSGAVWVYKGAPLAMPHFPTLTERLTDFVGYLAQGSVTIYRR